MKRYTLFLLLAILLSGAFLRFYRLKALGTFRGDQAIELSSTAKILQGKFTLIGIKTSISEVRNGAVMYYIMAPFLYLFRFDPVAGGIVQSFLSLGAVVIIFIIGKRISDDNRGLFAAFLVSFSPLLVRFSRQTLLAFYPLFFAGLSLLFIQMIQTKFSRKISLSLGFLSGFMLQVHYSTVSILLLVLLYPWVGLSKKYFQKYYLFTFLGFITGLLPIAIFELRHQFFNTKMFLSFLFEKKDFVYYSFNIFSYWIDVISRFLYGENQFIAIALIFTFIILIIRNRKKLFVMEKICILQILLVVAFTLIFVKEMVVHYAIVSFIPISLLAAGMLERYFQGFGIWLTAGMAVIFFIINFPLYGLLDNNGWTMSKGWNLYGVEKSARLIYEDIKSSSWKTNYNVAMIADAENQALPIRYFLDIWKYPPQSIEKYGQEDVLYVLSEPNIELEKISMWEITSFGSFSIEKTWPVQNGYALFRLGKKTV